MTVLADRGGQASVEAALLLPTVLALVAMLVQPACVFYTRSVMASTAGEVARLAATSRGSQEDIEAYALRRLEAVPDVSIFHEVAGERGETGEQDDGWDISVTEPEEGNSVTVEIKGSVRPLPLFGALVAALGTEEDGTVGLSVTTTQKVRATWIGGSYESWVDVWD